MQYLITLFLAACALLSIGCSSATTTPNSSSGNSANTNRSAAKPADDGHDHSKDGEVPRISLAEAKADFDKNAAVFVDTRGADAFGQEHVKGALNIPMEEIDAKYQTLPKDKKLIIYCSCPAEQTSIHFINKLTEKGVKNAFALVGGTKAWKNANYPMEGTMAGKTPTGMGPGMTKGKLPESGPAAGTAPVPAAPVDRVK